MSTFTHEHGVLARFEKYREKSHSAEETPSGAFVGVANAIFPRAVRLLPTRETHTSVRRRVRLYI